MHSLRHVPPLPLAAAELLDGLWVRVAVFGDGAVPSAELDALGQQVGRLVRDAGLLPEHLIIGLKTSWSANAALRARPDRAHANGLLAQVVSLCIRSYYEATDASPPVIAPRTALTLSPPAPRASGSRD